MNAKGTSLNSPIVTPKNWASGLSLKDLFPNPSSPLEVDLGCGKGRFIVARAQDNPHVNYLGVDRLLARIRKAEKKIFRCALENIKLLRIEALYALKYLLPSNSVHVFYMFFPDPWPKRRHHQRRLISHTFLHSLKQSMTKHGVIHIATDHESYFSHITECFQQSSEFMETEPFSPSIKEQTEFERIFVAKRETIKRCSYTKACLDM